MIDDPIGWRLYALPPKEKLDGFTNEPWQEDFKTQAEAISRKLILQAKGCVATVTPVFLSRASRTKIRKKHQVKLFA
jgi:hypothetical protein